MDRAPGAAPGTRRSDAQQSSGPYQADECRAPVRPVRRSGLRSGPAAQSAGTAVLRASLPAARARASRGGRGNPGRVGTAHAARMARLTKLRQRRSLPAKARGDSHERSSPPNGRSGTLTSATGPTVRAAARTSIRGWPDRFGEPPASPPSPSDMMVNAVLADTTIMVGAAVVLTLCYLLCWMALDRHRLARWES